MAGTLTLVRSSGGNRAKRRLGGVLHPRAYLADDTGLKVTLPYAPRSVELDGIVPTWSTIDRAGRKPLLLRDGEQLRAVSFDVPIADRDDHQASVEEALRELRDLARRGGRVTLGNLGPGEFVAASWRLTGYRQRSELRQHGTNHVTRAVVALSFTEASDVAIAVGPITGGAKPPPAVPPKPTAAGAKAARTYTVRAGDTLWAIAVRYYGDGSKWRRVADANGVRDPRKLRIGHVLTIPA